MTHNILIAVDHTDSAKAAFNWATRLLSREREQHACEATLLNVIGGRSHEGVELFGYARNHEELSAEALMNELIDDKTEQIETVVRAGDAAQTILAEAESRDADLIVVGTRHEGAIRQALLGSVSQTLASDRQRPVAAVPAESTIGTDFAVVGYDGSAGSRAALRWALANCEGDIRVIRAVSTKDAVIDGHEELSALLPALGHDADGRVRSEVVVGDSVEVLLNADSNAPQIIVGARNHNDGKDAIWGSTTTQVLAKTTRPVVIVPPGMWD